MLNLYKLCLLCIHLAAFFYITNRYSLTFNEWNGLRFKVLFLQEIVVNLLEERSCQTLAGNEF